VVGLLAVASLVVWSGAVDIAADNPHSAAVFNLLETARERSIAKRVRDIRVPDLTDEAMIRRGAGNYDSMCAACHLAPGEMDSELSAGLYPAPPNLTRHEATDAARAFWIIKHGVKATGMPAWGKSMEDNYIWDLVAFVRQLPSMSAEQYAAHVASSGGHSHGGGETAEHSHDSEEHAHGSEEHAHGSADADAQDADHGHEDAEPPAQSAKKVHTHADGKEHVH
jgi:mono/diheme cytochrome c family protein